MNLRKIGKGIKRIVIAGAMTTILSGCASRLPDSDHYFLRVGQSIALSLGLESTSMNIDIPSAYGNIPPHPDDPPTSQTRQVNLKSGNYISNNLEISISPIPYTIIENLRVGYKGTFPMSANQIREGLSSMEWYVIGAFAGTYSRVALPHIKHGFIASWRQPIDLGKDGKLFIEPGISYDMWDVRIQGGWDRYYEEQPMLEDRLSSHRLNPFIKLGVGIGTNDEIKRQYAAINLFWKPERIAGTTSQGDVKLSGNTFGIEVIYHY